MTTTPTQQSTETVTAQNTGSVQLPSARHCLTRHQLVAHFTIPRGARLRRVTVTVAGHRVATHRHGRTVVVRSALRWVHGPQFRVRAVLRVRRHGKQRVLRIRRTYRFCR